MDNTNLKILVFIEVLIILIVIIIKTICYFVKEYRDRKTMQEIFKRVDKIIKDNNKKEE